MPTRGSSSATSRCPGLRPVLLFVITTTVLASANMFGQSYLITQGAPGTETRTVIWYIVDQGSATTTPAGRRR